MSENLADYADVLVDADGYVRLQTGARIDSDHPVLEGGVIYDALGRGPGSMIWADGSRGIGCGQPLNFWTPKKVSPRPVYPPSMAREWTESELQVLQAVEFMILEALRRERQQSISVAHALVDKADCGARTGCAVAPPARPGLFTRLWRLLVRPR